MTGRGSVINGEKSVVHCSQKNKEIECSQFSGTA